MLREVRARPTRWMPRNDVMSGSEGPHHYFKFFTGVVVDHPCSTGHESHLAGGFAYVR